MRIEKQIALFSLFSNNCGLFLKYLPYFYVINQSTFIMQLRNIFLIVLFLFGLQNLSAQDISEILDLQWKTEIGQTTFRTNIIEEQGRIYVGSNGRDRAFLKDPKDGVYILNADDGSIVHQLDPETTGDADVNGVGISDGQIYFGNDRSEYYAFSLSGNEIWRYRLESEEGDAEGCPALTDLNGDGFKDAVFTTEGYGLIALNGITGELIWEYRIENYSRGTFMNSPAVYDLNNDGTDDVVFGSREEYPETWYGDCIVVLNGKDGSPIFAEGVSSGIHASPVILVRNGEAEIMFTECYSDISFFAPDGTKLRVVNLNEELPVGGISGLFATPIVTDRNALAVGSAWWGEGDRAWYVPLDEDHFEEDAYGNSTITNEAYRRYETSGRISASAFCADIVGNKKEEIGYCTESGLLFLYDQDNDSYSQYRLPARVEATPLVKDIDNDGKLEILIAGLDGKLYCYETKTKKKRVTVGQFRFNNQNTGVQYLD